MPYREFSREQDWLLPPSLSELLAADHPARFVAEFVDLLDLDEMEIGSKSAIEGAPRFRPQVLLAAWLYGFMVQVRSSRKLERACGENIAFMWLTAMQRPDHVTLWRFYRDNRAAMRQLLKQTVHLATEVGLVGFALQAVDGSRVGSAAWDSLQDRRSVAKLLAQVETEIAAMEQAEAAADTPDGQTSPGSHGLTNRQELRQRLRHALTVLDVAQAAPRSAGSDTETTTGEAPAQAAKACVKVSVTDPGAVVMKSRHGYLLGYNGQVVVDSKAQVIVAGDIVACANDSGQLAAMLAETQAMAGRLPQALVADTGYYAVASLEAAQASGVALYVTDRRALRRDGPAGNPYHKEHFVYEAASDTFRCPQGQVLRYGAFKQRGGRRLRIYQAPAHVCQACAAYHRGGCTTSKQGRRITIHGEELAVMQHGAKMQTTAARRILCQRKAIVEPIFAVFREQIGLQRFLVRSLEKVKAEWRLVCVAHNLRKLWKFWWRPKAFANLAA